MALTDLKYPPYQKNSLEKGNFFVKNNRVFQRFGTDDLRNTIEVKKTTVGTTATRIETPENAQDFTIFHQIENGVFYIDGESVTTGSIAVNKYDEIEFVNMKKNDENEIYGITSSGTIEVFAVGVIKE